MTDKPDKQLSDQLRQMKVNTKGLICLGCAHEDNCGIHGCNVIGQAAKRLDEVEHALTVIKKLYASTSGLLHMEYGDILSLFYPRHGDTKKVNVPPTSKEVTDFLVCENQVADLSNALRSIDNAGYRIVAATQDSDGTYTLFIRRPALPLE